MKAGTLILSILGAVALYNTQALALTHREAHDGGEHGYNDVVKTEIDGNVSISCKNPGWEACPQTVASIGDQAGLNHAFAQIAANNLSGTWYDPTYGLTTTWTATDSTGAESVIDVY